MTWRHFEHTADIGAEVEAPDLPDLFADAARALQGLLVEEGEVRPLQERRIELEAAPLPELLVAWLSELIFLNDTEGLVFQEYEFESLGEDGLAATVRGERLDPERHQLGREVKAATWHDLEVGRAGSGWRARVVFDL